MKQVFLNYSLNLISRDHPEYDDIRLAELRYGLEGFYITITKSMIIFIAALILGIFKEMLLLLLFFNILRTTGFGLHASTSGICLFSSSSIFLILPFIAQRIIIPLYIKVILSIIAIILIYLYAPSDTKKRPIISIKRRNIYKFITTFNTIILCFLAIYVDNNIISNLMLFGIYIEVILITPFTYRLFKMSYNNYLTYNSTPKLH